MEALEVGTAALSSLTEPLKMPGSLLSRCVGVIVLHRCVMCMFPARYGAPLLCALTFAACALCRFGDNIVSGLTARPNCFLGQVRLADYEVQVQRMVKASLDAVGGKGHGSHDAVLAVAKESEAKRLSSLEHTLSQVCWLKCRHWLAAWGKPCFGLLND